jgi:hypothetical protein
MDQDNKSLQLIMDGIYDRCLYDQNGVKRDPEAISSFLSSYIGSLESLLVLFMNRDYKEQIIHNLVTKLEDLDATSAPSIQQSEDDEEEGSFY